MRRDSRGYEIINGFKNPLMGYVEACCSYKAKKEILKTSLFAEKEKEEVAVIIKPEIFVCPVKCEDSI